MKQQNFFEDPKGVLEEIQLQSTLLQQQQQQEQPLQQHELQPHYTTLQPQQLPQARRRLSTFTAPSTIQPSPSWPVTTAPSQVTLPSSNSLDGEQLQQRPTAPAVNRRPKPGILRLDMSKPRRSSGGSVEFRMQPHMYGANISTPTGTTPPAHQLSVTWATPPCGSTERDFKVKPGTPTPGSLVAASGGGIEIGDIISRRRSPEEKPHEFSLSYAASNLASPVTEPFIDFPLPRHYEDHNQSPGYSIHTANTDNNYDGNDDDDDDEEDYSVSVSAIMQRRASVRGYRRKSSSRNSRRASSPMDHVLDNAERRRSSVYTTSSDEGTNQESTQEQIFENIRLHKEVIQSVKLQPWPIRKKLKLVRQAKTYVARHEGALQERFAMSRSTRDLWARFKIVMAARWRHWKRETYSFLTVLIPWELRIKEIESHFGSGVASYFTFLRWLMYMNVMIALPLLLFVIGPEYFLTKKDSIDSRKKMTNREYGVAGNLLTIWEFEGYLKYSPLFYGYYSSHPEEKEMKYLLPLAYFLTAVAVYIYSFVATLRKMAENSRNSKLSSKDDECTFSWKLFTGWDFMIGHAETAHNRIASVVVGFKEALLEEAEKKKDKRNWRIIMQRILVNILVIALLAASGWTVVTLVNMSEELAKRDDWLSKNAVNVTMNCLSFLLPMIFEALGLFENWHPRQQLRLQLARIMILNLLTLYSLMFSFIWKIRNKEQPLIGLHNLNNTLSEQLLALTQNWQNISSSMTTTVLTTTQDFSTAMMDTVTASSTTDALMSTTTAALLKIRCYNQTVRCSKPWRLSTSLPATTTLATTTLILLNLTSSMMPAISTTEPSTETTTAWTTLPPTTPTTETTTLPSTTITSTMDYRSTTLDLLTTLPYSQSSEDTEAPDTTDEDVFSTTGASSTTTTELPVNDTFFEYYDYFDGLSFDAKDEQLLVEDENNIAETQGKNKRALKSKKNKKKPTSVSPNDVYKTTLEPIQPKSGKQGKRKGKPPKVQSAKANGPDPLSVQLLRKSKYSRRDRQENDNSQTSTMASAASTMSTTVDPITTTIAMSSATAELTTNDLDYSSSTPPSSTTTTTTTSETEAGTTKAIRWEPNRLLQELSDFFTTSTMKPFKSKDTTPLTTTLSDNEEDQLIDGMTSTPFYLDGEQETGQTVSYNLDELDETFEWCIRTVCYEEPATDANLPTSTVASSTTKQPTAEQNYTKTYNDIYAKLEEIELNLTTMCWETSLGQELAKVVVLDGITATVLSLCIDFLRALFVRYVNQNWCWDMEKTFPQYGDFKIAENILALINNQGQVWMGIFFSPGLVIINLVKLVIMMYFRSWIVLTCNVPHEVVFKASKSNNFYLSLLLTMLFLCVLPVGYAIVWLRPSWHCGPYSKYPRISEFITNTTKAALPETLHGPLNYLTSSSTVIPLLLLLILIIYYLVSLTGALREANQDLKTQLQKEREEERKKFFKIPEIKAAENTSTTLTNRWRKVLDASSPVTPTAQPDFESEEYKTQARKELISRIMKKALRKDSATSDEETFARHGRDDDTDTEHHDSLPHDEDGNEKRPGLSKLQEIRRTRKPSLVDIVQIANSERRSLRHQAMGNGGKSKSKTEKAEKKREQLENEKENSKENGNDKNKESEKEKAKDSTDNGNDPEIKTRVINERRQSLLRKKKEEEEKQKTLPKDEDKEKTLPKDKENEITKIGFKIKDLAISKEAENSNEKVFDKNKENEKNKRKIQQVDNEKKKLRTKESVNEITKEKLTYKDKSKDDDKVVKIKLGSPIKKRIYESFRRKKRDDKEKFVAVKQSSLEKANEEETNTEANTQNSTKKDGDNFFKRSLHRKDKPTDELKSEKSPSAKSSYKVVDEKSPTTNEEKHSPPVLEQLHNLGGKLKFKRHKLKSSTEPEVFKFEADKISKEADIATNPTWSHLETELQSPRVTDEIVTTPTSLHHLNLGADKLASLSRQSRRKIGSFLASMKDAVTRPDREQHDSSISIDIPSTPRAELTSALNNAFMLPVAMHTTTTTTNSIQPYVMPRAPLEMPEDIEPPSYSHSMAARENNTKTVKDPEELDKPGPIIFPQRGISQRRRPIRQDSQSSSWSSDNIPTITISATPEMDDQSQSPPPAAATAVQPETVPSINSPGPVVNVIKINIEQDK